jgi:hypothetical protein
VLTLDLARRLADARRTSGDTWEPEPGDRFAIPDRDLDGVFVVAEMTIEVQDLPTGRLIKFNGTTEWALDSIPAAEVLWVPWEHQLRDRLGDRLARLERLAGEPGGWAVVLTDGSRHVDVDPESAYARALLGDS